MKTTELWGVLFLASSPPFAGIDEEGIDEEYGRLTAEERLALFNRLQFIGGRDIQYGLVKKFFDDFYNAMAEKDLIVLGTGDRVNFLVRGVLEVSGGADFAPGRTPRHCRPVRPLWTGNPLSVPEWSWVRRLESVDSFQLYTELARVLCSLLSAQGMDREGGR